MSATYSKLLLTGIALWAAATPASAGESVIGIRCEEEGIGARIYLNGEYRGDCPIKLFANPGDVTLRVVKPEGAEHERVYEETFYLPGDSFKNMRIELSAPQLTAEAKRQRELAEQQKEREALEAALSDARAGKALAMRQLAEMYATGKGVAQSEQQAQYWREKAAYTVRRNHFETTLANAERGIVEAMRELASLYREGKGVERSDAQARAWLERADRTAAESALAAAKSGNIEGMRLIAQYYAEGVGVARDIDASKEWSDRADAAQAERSERERVERIRREAQKELDEIQYFGVSKTVINGMGVEGMPAGLKTLVLVYSPAYFLWDVTRAPTIMTKSATLKKRLAERAAGFRNPDSMIANASKSR